MTDAQTKEIAVKPENFAITQIESGNFDLQTLVEENLGGEQITPFDLERITVPPAGTTNWVIPTPDGEVETKELNGIVLATQKTRSFWKEELSGEGTPPDCTSIDMIHGFGEPGGECAKCPQNQFQSGANGYSKACKETEHVFMLLQDSVMPVVLQIPPTSLKRMKKYKAQLIGKQKSINGTITTFTLQKDKAGSGFQYNMVVPTDGAALSQEQYEAVKKYKQGIDAILNDGNSAPVQ